MKSIGIIGSGNVARILGATLSQKVDLKFIYSSTPKNAQKLAESLDVPVLNSLDEIPDVDLLIIAVNDDQIENLCEGIPEHLSVVHTSGSKGIEVLSKFENYGVLYPLQTLGKNINIDVNEIPFLIESSSNSFEEQLTDFICKFLSLKVQKANSEKRKKIHIAAVFASNFVVQMLIEAEKLLATESLSFDLLKPLINETIHNCLELSPEKSLTGPAKRGDKKIVGEHLDRVADRQLNEIYKIISDRIMSNP